MFFSPEYLSNRGFFEPERAAQEIRELSRFLDKELLQSLVEEISHAPDPDMALGNIERWISSSHPDMYLACLKESSLMKRVCALFGYSESLSNIFLKNPADYLELLCSPQITERRFKQRHDEVLKALSSGVDDIAILSKILRDYRRKEMFRIGVKDLIRIDDPVVLMKEISDLASACLENATSFSLKQLEDLYGVPYFVDYEGNKKRAEFCVIGLGKLGGEELNYSSDVDIFFIYSSDRGETEGGRSGSRINLHTFYVKASEQIVKLIGNITEDGFVFRVDLRLRPEGINGDLAYSLRSAEIYYESWGQTWERAALIKARPVAGSVALGEEFLKVVEPFVYRRYLDFGAIDEIKAIKKRIESSLWRNIGRGQDLKLGEGGIREIEFFLQAHQLIYGGRNRRIRERNTLNTIERLVMEGIIDEQDGEGLRRAYIFFRETEHKIQLYQERQTHSLPLTRRDMRRLARALGFTDSDKMSAEEKFQEVLRIHTERVKSIFNRLFSGGERDEATTVVCLDELFQEEQGGEDLILRLRQIGFKRPERAYENLRLLYEGPPFAHFSEKTKELLRRMAPRIMGEVAKNPDPDKALINLEKFLSSVGARRSYYALLYENPQILKTLMHLFGTSDFLSNYLIEHPEILDTLLLYGSAHIRRQKDEISRELEEALEGVEDIEEILEITRQFRHAELLRVGINDIAGELGLEEVTAQLSDIADICVEKAMEISWKHLTRVYGIPEGSGDKPAFLILGMGKLGGREINYYSDLDLIFIYSSTGETRGGEKRISNHEFFTKLAQRIISFLSVRTRGGILYQIDTRLRPSGNAGPLVCSLSSFEEYHRRSSWLWERFALLKARAVAGDPILAEEIKAIIEKFVFLRPVEREALRELHHLRRRMEVELAKEGEGKYNIKVGKGGIVDVEFIIQALQIIYGKDDVELRQTNSFRLLNLLQKRDYLPEGDSKVLMDGYYFLRNLENRLRLLHDRSLDEIEAVGDRLIPIARSMGYVDERGLLHDYSFYTSHIRRIYMELFQINI